MSINAKAVVRCIIGGEWIWVERGTFTVMPFEFVDDDGNRLGLTKEPAYFFISTNGDPYFGPLSGIQLMKLDNQLLDEAEAGPRKTDRRHELGTGSGEGEPGSTPAPSSPGSEASPEQGRVPLFAGDAEPVAPVEAMPEEAEPAKAVPEEAEPAEPSRRGGLF